MSLGEGGGCPHGVTDDICTDCTIDNVWRLVVEEIPSRHFIGGVAANCTGFRKWLAQEAMGRDRLRYLEIGVRLGHTLALVTLCADVMNVHQQSLEFALGVDAWIENYGDEPNPGPEVLFDHLQSLNAPWNHVSLLTGDSHTILPTLRDIDRRFNLILVDGDHTESGARQDLDDAWAMLEVGGQLVFDDAVVKGDETLLRIWKDWSHTFRGSTGGIEFGGSTGGVEFDQEPAFCWVNKGPA